MGVFHAIDFVVFPNADYPAPKNVIDVGVTVLVKQSTRLLKQ